MLFINAAEHFVIGKRQTNPDWAPIIAALPERLLDRSLPAPGLLAYILVSKNGDYLPLYLYAPLTGGEPRSPFERPCQGRDRFAIHSVGR